MPNIRLVDNCLSRIPWPTFANILKAKNLPVGQGKEKTSNKLIAFGKDAEQNAKKVNTLEDSYFEHLLAGEKAFTLFLLSSDIMKHLIAGFNQYDPEESPLVDHFPFLLSEEDLLQIEPDEPLLVKIETLDIGLALIFCTRRLVTERKELSLDDFCEETRNELSGYEEIIAVKHTNRQFFDVVVLRTDLSAVEIRADVSGNIPSAFRTIAFRQIRNKFNELAGELGIESPLEEMLNLYPAVEKLYDSTEGRVCELGFITDENSIKHERQRRKEVDLRTETYHHAGRNAVPHITPYRLGICWDIPIAEDVQIRPELFFPGHVRLLSEETQLLESAIITKCSGLTDYEFIFRKVSESLDELNQHATNNR